MLGAASSFSATSLNRLHHCDSASFVTPNLLDSTINVLFLKHPESLNQYTRPGSSSGGCGPLPSFFVLFSAARAALILENLALRQQTGGPACVLGRWPTLSAHRLASSRSVVVTTDSTSRRLVRLQSRSALVRRSPLKPTREVHFVFGLRILLGKRTSMPSSFLTVFASSMTFPIR